MKKIINETDIISPLGAEKGSVTNKSRDYERGYADGWRDRK